MALQKSTSEITLTAVQEDYVAFTAVGGLLPSDDGFGVKMTASEFAEKIGVDRTTLYLWRKTIPNFWDRVSAKRKDIGGKDRLTNVWNSMYMKAVQGNTDAAKLYLANHDPEFRMPTQPIEHEVGNSWAALMAAKQSKLEAEIPEAEVINETDKH